MLEEVLKWLGAGDEAINSMGPLITIAIAVVGGGFFTQVVKFWLRRGIKDDGLFDWCTRAVAVLATFVLAYYLGDAVPGWLAAVVGVCQPGIYHLGISTIRRYWPWLEASKMVGSVNPDQSVLDAAAARKGQ